VNTKKESPAIEIKPAFNLTNERINFDARRADDKFYTPTFRRGINGEIIPNRYQR